MPRLVYIRWLDAQGDHGQTSLGELNDLGALPVETAGFLISENDEVVRISQDIMHFKDFVRYRDTEVIPRIYIQSMKVVEVEDSDAS